MVIIIFAPVGVFEVNSSIWGSLSYSESDIIITVVRPEPISSGIIFYRFNKLTTNVLVNYNLVFTIIVRKSYYLIRFDFKNYISRSKVKSLK